MFEPDSELEIKPRRGEEYLLDKNCQDLVKSIIFPLPTGKSKGTLVIPTVDGTIMVGPTAEDGCDKDEKTTTTDGM